MRSVPAPPPPLRRLLAAALVVLAGARAGEASERTIHGRVLDGSGRGLGGVDVAAAWIADAAGMKPLQGVRTDAEGRFSIEFPFLGEAATFLAYDAPRTHGALLTVEPGVLGRDHDFTLAPTIKVHGDLSVDAGKFYPAGGVCWLETDPRSTCLVRVDPDKGSFALSAPPGTYSFTALAPARVPTSLPMTLSAAKPDVSLGKIDLADRKGRVPIGTIAPPLTDTASAPALEALIRARHFPSRWTLLYFWDHT